MVNERPRVAAQLLHLTHSEEDEIYKTKTVGYELPCGGTVGSGKDIARGGIRPEDQLQDHRDYAGVDWVAGERYISLHDLSIGPVSWLL